MLSTTKATKLAQILSGIKEQLDIELDAQFDADELKANNITKVILPFLGKKMWISLVSDESVGNIVQKVISNLEMIVTNLSDNDFALIMRLRKGKATQPPPVSKSLSTEEVEE